MFVSVINSLLFWHKSVVETVVDSGSHNCPNEFYEILRNRRKPKDDKRKHGMLLEAFKSLAKLAIDNGDDDTFGHAFARIMQTTEEVQEKVAQKTRMGPVSPNLVNDPSITPYPPMMPTKTKAQKKKADQKNNSSMGS
jgi:hypothetical protein